MTLQILRGARSGMVVEHLLANSKMSGSSLASFSLATSAIGPKVTTGLKNPADCKQEQVNICYSSGQRCLRPSDNL